MTFYGCAAANIKILFYYVQPTFSVAAYKQMSGAEQLRQKDIPEDTELTNIEGRDHQNEKNQE